MPKATKPKSAKKKTTPKKAATAAQKPAKKVAAQKPTLMQKDEQRAGFMWRLLKQKEAERLDSQKKNSGFSFKSESAHDPHAKGFSRFAGPRRRAG